MTNPGLLQFYIVTPCLNVADTIDQTISSIVSQAGDFTIRYHVQDGGSGDETVQKLQNWATVLREDKKVLNCRGVDFSWQSEPDRGMYEALGKGFAQMRPHPYEFMTWVNGDDLLMPGALAMLSHVARCFPQVSFIGGPKYLIDYRGDKIFECQFPTPTKMIADGLCDGRHWYFLQQEGTFFKSSLWLKGRHALEGFKLAGDWNLWREFARHEPYYQLDRPLGAFRKRKGQASAENIEQYLAEIEAVLPFSKRSKLFQSLDKEEEKYAYQVRYKEPPEQPEVIKDYESVAQLFARFREKNRYPGPLPEINPSCYKHKQSGVKTGSPDPEAFSGELKEDLYRQVEKLARAGFYHREARRGLKRFQEVSAGTAEGGLLKSKTFWGAPVNLLPGDDVSASIYALGFFEPELSLFFAEFLRPGQVVIDIGAHLGYFSMLAAELTGPGGRVVAFEPTPATAELLAKNLSAYPQARIVPGLAWNRREKVAFKTFGQAGSAFNTAVTDRLSEAKKSAASCSTIDVEAICLDQYCREKNIWPDLVKIDAENSELQVLQGMSSLLEKCRPVVTMEVGDLSKNPAPELPSSRELIGFLQDCGYVALETLGCRLKGHFIHERPYRYDNLIMAPRESSLGP